MLRKRVLFVLALMQSFCHAPVRLQSTVPGRKLGSDAEAGGAFAVIIHIFDRWIDSVTHMTGIVPQPDHRLGQAVFVADHTYACCV